MLDAGIELVLVDPTENALLSSKAYLQLLDVKHFYDHYTVGQGVAMTPLSTADEVDTAYHPYVPISPNDVSPDFAIFVHGWRMLYFSRC